jgi:putative addiction module component (TIGR02574 family)
MNTSLFDQVRQLSVEEQIELVEALWDNIVAKCRSGSDRSPEG